MRKWCYVCLLLLLVAFFLQSYINKENPKLIKDIAYSTNSSAASLVYVSENGNFVPFIVAAGNYNGNVLLIRKDILLIPRRINDYSSYYEYSDIDTYLNTEYINAIALPEDTIISSKIDIMDENAIGYSGKTITSIYRKVFLLSLAEVGVTDLTNAGMEGSALSYFGLTQNRIAYAETVPVSWWLRTPNTYYLSCTYGVGPDGKIGSGNSYDENGIRPAFCGPASSPISLVDNIIAGENVYVLSDPD